MGHETIAELLRSMQDVPGIQGSFLVDPVGHVLARDLPSLFPDIALNAAGQRIAKLFDSLLENTAGTDEVYLAFDGYSLMLRQGSFGTLAIVAVIGTSPEALRMSSTVLIRRLELLFSQPVAPHVPPITPVALVATLREAGFERSANLPYPNAVGRVPTPSHPGSQQPAGPARPPSGRTAPTPVSDPLSGKPTSRPEAQVWRPGDPPAQSQPQAPTDVKKKSDIWK